MTTLPLIARMRAQLEATERVVRFLDGLNPELAQAVIAALYEGYVQRKPPPVVRHTRPAQSTAERVRADVLAHPGTRIRDVAFRLKLPYGRVNENIKRELQRGHLERTGRGTYGPTSKGTSP